MKRAAMLLLSSLMCAKESFCRPDEQHPQVRRFNDPNKGGVEQFEAIKGNIAEDVYELKRQPGQDILVAGSGELGHTLLQHELTMSADSWSFLLFSGAESDSSKTGAIRLL